MNTKTFVNMYECRWNAFELLSFRFTFLVAELCLLAASVRNAYHTRYLTVFGNGPPSCETVRKGVFAAGAAFVFFTAALAELHYAFYAKARAATLFPPAAAAAAPPHRKESSIGMTSLS